MDDHPQQLLDYWADVEVFRTTHDPEDWPVSEEIAETYKAHLISLKPLADSGNDLARYAIASIYLLGLAYSDEEAREKCEEEDHAKMTQLLCQCAENGMSVAFDNLVTSGTGEIGEHARAAAREFEESTKPDWDDQSRMPVYTPSWMEGATNLWRKKRSENRT